MWSRRDELKNRFIGRRTGTNILPDKTLRKQVNGKDVFEDYWTDSEEEEGGDVFSALLEAPAPLKKLASNNSSQKKNSSKKGLRNKSRNVSYQAVVTDVIEIVSATEVTYSASSEQNGIQQKNCFNKTMTLQYNNHGHVDDAFVHNVSSPKNVNVTHTIYCDEPEFSRRNSIRHNPGTPKSINLIPEDLINSNNLSAVENRCASSEKKRALTFDKKDASSLAKNLRLSRGLRDKSALHSKDLEQLNMGDGNSNSCNLSLMCESKQKNTSVVYSDFSENQLNNESNSSKENDETVSKKNGRVKVPTVVKKKNQKGQKKNKKKNVLSAEGPAPTNEDKIDFIPESLDVESLHVVDVENEDVRQTEVLDNDQILSLNVKTTDISSNCSGNQMNHKLNSSKENSGKESKKNNRGKVPAVAKKKGEKKNKKKNISSEAKASAPINETKGPSHVDENEKDFVPQSFTVGSFYAADAEHEGVCQMDVLDNEQISMEEVTKQKLRSPKEHTKSISPSLVEKKKKNTSRKRKTNLLLGPKESEANEENAGALRRSKRQCHPPLKYWANERLQYRYTKSGSVECLGIVRESEDYLTFEELAKKRKKLKVEMKPKLPLPRPRKSLVERGITVLDAENNEEVHASVVIPYDCVLFRRPQNPSLMNKFEIGKSFKLDNAAFGFLRLEPHQTKPLQYLPEYQAVFVVLKGKVEVSINKTRLILGELDTFIVPKANAYAVTNLLDTEALLHFAATINSYLHELKNE